MDQVEVPSDNFGERILGMVPGVAREQFEVRVSHVQKDNVTGVRNPPKNFIYQGTN